ncbi:MAG: helix-turn-helix transcriptional regulator [Candidatus Gastranaerophilales bacterium]
MCIELSKKHFGKRIKELREIKGFSQENLSERVCLETLQLSRIETGKSFTTFENLVKIAKELDVSVMSLFDFEHIQDEAYLKRNIESFLEKANYKEIQFVYNFINSLKSFDR